MKKKNYDKFKDYETWNLDNTFARFIVPRLKRFRELVASPDTVYGYPGTLNNMEEWLEILDKIIWAFEQYDKDYQEDYYSGEPDIQFIKIDTASLDLSEEMLKDLDPDGKGMFEMVDGPNNTFKVDHEGIKAHEAKMQEGIDLFSQYYGNLWT